MLVPPGPVLDAILSVIDASMTELATLAQGIAIVRELTPRTKDELVARGERLSAHLFSAALHAAGHASAYVDALQLIRTDGQFGNAAPDLKATDTLVDVAFGAGKFVGVGLHGLRSVTEDGLKWTQRFPGEEGEHLNSILWTGDRFVAVGQGATYSSPDGLEWTRKENKDAPLAAAYGGGVFVGTNYKGKILRSTDALEWTQVYKAEYHFEAVAWG